MIQIARITVLAVLCGAWTSGPSDAYSVPKDQQDLKKVYWGSLNQFEKPAEVVMFEVVKSTPEYKKVAKDNVERGTGQYWILMEKATQRSLRAVTAFAEDSDYDLIALAGYLGSLDPPIASDDVTDAILKKMAEEG